MRRFSRLLSWIIGWLVAVPIVAMLLSLGLPAFSKIRDKRRVVALINGSGPVFPGDLSASIRSKKRVRDEALDRVIDDRLLKDALSSNGNDRPRACADSFQQFLKQFEGDEWKQRAEWQGLNEVSLRQRIGDETMVSEALETELARRAPNVSEENTRRWYDSHCNNLVNPERVHASHIFLTRHDKANPDRTAEVAEIRRKLLGHEATFEVLAARYSDDERSKRGGGDLGWFSRGRVPQDFGDKVFALSVGQVSEVFETNLGWHIALVKEKRAAEPLTFEQAKPEIEARLTDERRRNALGALLSELRQTANIERFEDHIAKVEPAP